MTNNTNPPPESDLALVANYFGLDAVPDLPSSFMAIGYTIVFIPRLTRRIRERLPIAGTPWKSGDAYRLDPATTLDEVHRGLADIDGILTAEAMPGDFPPATGDELVTERRDDLRAALRETVAAYRRLRKQFRWMDEFLNGQPLGRDALLALGRNGPKPIASELLDNLDAAVYKLDWAMGAYRLGLKPGRPPAIPLPPASIPAAAIETPPAGDDEGQTRSPADEIPLGKSGAASKYSDDVLNRAIELRQQVHPSLSSADINKKLREEFPNKHTPQTKAALRSLLHRLRTAKPSGR